MTFTTPGQVQLLGVTPVLRHLFTNADDKYNGDVRKVVLSYSLGSGYSEVREAYWARRYSCADKGTS